MASKQKGLLWIWVLLFMAAWSWAATDWVAPVPDARYDWRNTTWFGASGGTITGPGVSVQHWGESAGYKVTCLPLAVHSASEDFMVLFLGGAYLQSINHPEAQTANRFGFTSVHFYWYAGGFGGYAKEYDAGDPAYGGALNAGFGVDLNRRDARWSWMVGLGPYYYKSKNTIELQIMPVLEFSYHFGSPKRVAP